MRVAEDKVTGLLKYELGRIGKIIVNAGSEDARIMRAKRKAWKKARKEAR